MSFSLIVPAAANKPEYENIIPTVFRLNEKGISVCVEAALSLGIDQFASIYFTILKIHDEKYGLSDMLNMQFRRLGMANAKVVVIDEPTSSQAETIYATIIKESIQGAIFIKDADCSFGAEIFPHNGIVVYPLEKLSMVNPQHKSYVAVDDMLYITNTIEKRVIDHYFNAGGYCFEDAETFASYYERFAGMHGLYLSHIVYSMLLDGHIFRPFIAENYKDWELN